MATTDADRSTETAPDNGILAALHPGRLMPSLLAGALNGVLMIALAISFAALIFSGELLPFLPRGIGMGLLSGTVGAIIVTLLSSYRLIISTNQDVPAAILAIVAAAVAASVGATGATFATVAVVIALTTLAAALLFLGLGVFRLTGLVRFLPYPVVGGFLAGTGWLLFTGGIGMMSGSAFSLAGLGELLAPGVAVYWLPGAILGALILFLSTRIRHYLFMPAAILTVVALFYLAAFVRGASLAELSAGGWLLGPFPSGRLWQPIGPAELGNVEWSAVWPQVPKMLTAVGLSAVAMLLNATGLELAIRQDLDLNREMRAAGWANLVGGLGGGFITYPTLSMSTLNARLGAGGRLAGLVAAGLVGVVLLFGGSALGVFPKMVFGALLVYLGLSFLWEWVVAARRRLPPIDYGIVLAILVIVAAVGFLQAVAVGIVAAVVLFVVSYSRSSVVKHELSAATFKSRVTRGPDDWALLQDLGDQAYYLQLQGFIFFGTAYSLLEQVRLRVRDVPTRYVVLDFRQVIGLDSTGLLSFDKMGQLARENGFVLVLAGLSRPIREQFQQGGLAEEPGAIQFAADLDRAAEWCEDQICLAAGPSERTLTDYLQAIVPGPATARLVDYLERREVVAGTHLIRQGDDSDALFFLESGQVTAQLEQPDRRPVRLETMRGGRTVGELGLYLGTRRSAAVIADEPSVVYMLSRERLAEMEDDDPRAASALHRVIVHLLGERVLHLVRAVDALQS